MKRAIEVRAEREGEMLDQARALGVPAGWEVVGGSKDRGMFAIQLKHVGLTEDKVRLDMLHVDQPGWVRGTGPNVRAAMRDAKRRAAKLPPKVDA